MQAKFQVDRHFLFLHGKKLTVFAERVLRKSQKTSYISCKEEFWTELSKRTDDLHRVLANLELKRKERTEAVREKEAPVLVALGEMAKHVEATASCKSDVFTTGFRPHTEHRKLKKEGVETRRRQRVSAKMAQLQDPEPVI